MTPTGPRPAPPTDLLPVPGSPSLFAGTFTVPAGRPGRTVRLPLQGAAQRLAGPRTTATPRSACPTATSRWRSTRTTRAALHLRPRDPPRQGRPGPAGGRPDRAPTGPRRRQPARGPHPRELLLRHGRPVRERRPRRTTRRHRRAPGSTTGSTRPTRPSTTAVTCKGIIERLDYIEGLGTTAIWMTPSFKNKPVQGEPGTESAGYHGYWITDFTQIDPHLGTNAELKTLIDLAHERGMKVFFDIITNHTADVLDYPDVRLRRHRAGAVPDQGRASPYKDADGQPVRRPRLHLHRRPVPRGRPRGLLPVRADLPGPGRRAGQGPGLAQRPDDVPQPRHVDLLRREQRVRRLPLGQPLRARRPVDRAARGRRRA